MITHPGIGRYIRSLLTELTRKYPEDKFILFGDPDKLSDFSGKSNVIIKSWKVPIYSVWEQMFGGYLSKDVDVLHTPHFNFPLCCGKKQVITLHDLIYLLFPEAIPSPFARHYAKYMINAALKKADKVIAVSENTRKDLIGNFGRKYSSKIEVIYEAADEKFSRVSEKAGIADIRTRYRLEKNIILYVGSVKPHKNVSTLIRAFSRIKAWGVPHQLVICGRWDKKEDYLKGELNDRNICYVGEVPTKDLVGLYSMADVLVHLSLYEGFGLTVLEAMKCGTPVIVSNSSSLPEVSGSAAFTVSPEDVDQIADTIYNVLINPQLRNGMIEEGEKQVKRFSWEETARKTMEVYRGVVG